MTVRYYNKSAYVDELRAAGGHCGFVMRPPECCMPKGHEWAHMSSTDALCEDHLQEMILWRERALALGWKPEESKP